MVTRPIDELIPQIYYELYGGNPYRWKGIVMAIAVIVQSSHDHSLLKMSKYFIKGNNLYASAKDNLL